jgi:hypothetical protein
MEKLKDVLDNIRDRFSNPLIFSFLISWLIFNWEITVALLWYDSSQLQSKGFNSIFDFISCKLNKDCSIFFPILFSVFYTGFSPIVKNVIRAFYSWTQKWGENWNLKIVKGGNISIDKYLFLRERYLQKIEQLEYITKEESKISQKYNHLDKEHIELKREISKTQNFIKEITDSSFLNGYWECRFKKRESSSTNYSVENIRIFNNDYYIIGDFGHEKHVFNIRSFFKYHNHLVFVKEGVFDKGILNQRYLFNNLNIEGNGRLVGTENGEYDIEYIRKTNQKTNEGDNASGDQLYPIY